MNSLESNILQKIFSYVEFPIDLLQLACVNKQFYTLARANNSWLAHEKRIVTQFPSLLPLFEKYRNTKTDNGNRVKLTKRRKTNVNWRTPKGIWYVFARHLLFKTITQVLSRKSSREYVVDAICQAAMNPAHIIDIVHRSHIKLAQCRFQRCVCLPNFTFIWIGMIKGNALVSIYSEQTAISTIKSELLMYNFKCIVRNTLHNKRYIF